MRERLIEQVSRLVFGRANDCVKLALDPDAPVDSLDLTLLTELRRSERGAVEVRLADRLAAAELLDRLCPETDGAEDFLKALAAGAGCDAAE